MQRLARALGAILLVAALQAAPVAQATPVSIGYTGIITIANADTATLFGLAPGSAVGAVISGNIAYDPATFGAPLGGSGYRYWDSSDGSMPARTIAVTATVNGITVTYDGLYYNGLLVATSTGLYPYGTYGQALEIVSESYTPSGLNAIEFNFVSDVPASMLMNPALDPAGPFNLNAALQSNFFFGAGWNTPDLHAVWVFNVTSAGIPEPASALLLLPAALALIGAQRAASTGRKPSRFGMRMAARRCASSVAPSGSSPLRCSTKAVTA